jgi:hypothetical protein
MTEYYIEWRIELDATSPEDAARKALAIQHDPFSTSTVFHVRADKDDDFTVVDLEVAEVDNEEGSA